MDVSRPKMRSVGVPKTTRKAVEDSTLIPHITYHVGEISFEGGNDQAQQQRVPKNVEILKLQKRESLLHSEESL